MTSERVLFEFPDNSYGRITLLAVPAPRTRHWNDRAFILRRDTPLGQPINMSILTGHSLAQLAEALIREELAPTELDGS